MTTNGPMIDVDSDLKKFAVGARDSVAAAVALGWAGRWTNVNKTMLILRSPGGEKTINVPTTSLNHNRAKSMLRQVLSYTDRDSVVSLVEGRVDVTKMDPAMVRARLILGHNFQTHFTEWLDEQDKDNVPVSIVTVPEPKPTPPPVEREARAIRRRQPGIGERTPHPTEGMSIEEMLSTESVKIVSRKPYLANATGTPYESEFIDEVLFDNNMSAYGCRSCDFISNRPRSVSNHAKRHSVSANPNTRVSTEPKFVRGDARPEHEATDHGQIVVEKRGLTLYAHLIAGGVDSNVAVRASEAVLDLPHDDRVALALAIIEGRELPAAREQIADLTAQLEASAAEVERLREERRTLRDLLAEES